MASDWDDVGAAAVLHALADNGDATIVAMGVSSKDTQTRGVPRRNQHLLRPRRHPDRRAQGPGRRGDIEVYRDRRQGVSRHDLASTAAAPDVIEVYRKALAAQPDGSVVFVTVGYLTNARDLLQSKPDRHSPLSGVDLVKKKVKRWVCMAWRFPKGREWNIHRDAPAAIASVRDWPTPILFSGFEIGREIMTGGPASRHAAGQPRIWLAYEKCNGSEEPRELGPDGGVRGHPRPGRSLGRPYGRQRGNTPPTARTSGATRPTGAMPIWSRGESPAEVAAVIEALMLQPPKHQAK